MTFKLVIPALAALATLMAVPAHAQYDPAYGPRHYGPVYGAPAYGVPAFRGAYNYGPVTEPPFYRDGWVPVPIFDRSRPGGIDPDIRPSN